jgi:hypothetical protein
MGVHLNVIQKLMNHQDRKTAEIYARLSQAPLAEAIMLERLGIVKKKIPFLKKMTELLWLGILRNYPKMAIPN